MLLNDDINNLYFSCTELDMASQQPDPKPLASRQLSHPPPFQKAHDSRPKYSRYKSISTLPTAPDISSTSSTMDNLTLMPSTVSGDAKHTPSLENGFLVQVSWDKNVLQDF